MSDPVKQPPHYQGLKEALGVEVIDIIEACDFGYHLSSVLKYLFRHEYKGKPVEDLKKAAWYLERYIELRESEELFEDEADLAVLIERKNDMYQGFVQPSADRIAGDDEAAQSIKDEYYQFERFAVRGWCANCDSEISMTQPFIRDGRFDDKSSIWSARMFCTQHCADSLRLWQKGLM